MALPKKSAFCGHACNVRMAGKAGVCGGVWVCDRVWVGLRGVCAVCGLGVVRGGVWVCALYAPYVWGCVPVTGVCGCGWVWGVCPERFYLGCPVRVDKVGHRGI